MKKKTRKKRKKLPKSKKQNIWPFTFGKINSDRKRILTLILMIIFMMTVMVFTDAVNSLNPNKFLKDPDQNKNIALAKEISKLVQGYPIARMTPYISQQDPKVAAFLVAIAKKESNWGKNRPVLNGQDCYNYWGFRLKTDKMGSDGHTCFDSPKEAVDTVASRIGEMVNEENIDSPRDMIVWKCGYDCQNGNKSASEQKWIKDVNFYYNKLADYL